MFLVSVFFSQHDWNPYRWYSAASIGYYNDKPCISVGQFLNIETSLINGSDILSRNADIIGVFKSVAIFYTHVLLSI